MMQRAIRALRWPLAITLGFAFWLAWLVPDLLVNAYLYLRDCIPYQIFKHRRCRLCHGKLRYQDTLGRWEDCDDPCDCDCDDEEEP